MAEESLEVSRLREQAVALKCGPDGFNWRAYCRAEIAVLDQIDKEAEAGRVWWL